MARNSGFITTQVAVINIISCFYSVTQLRFQTDECEAMRIVLAHGDSLLSVTRISPCIKYEEIVRHDVTEGYLPHHEARCGGGECVGQGRRLVPADQVLCRLRQILNDTNCN